MGIPLDHLIFEIFKKYGAQIFGKTNGAISYNIVSTKDDAGNLISASYYVVGFNINEIYQLISVEVIDIQTVNIILHPINAPVQHFNVYYTLADTNQFEEKNRRIIGFKADERAVKPLYSIDK